MNDIIDSRFVIGVDIGGSHITAAIVDIASSSVVSSTFTRRHVDPQATKEEIIRAWGDTILSCRKNQPEQSIPVGIAMPGPFDYDLGVSKITGLHKFESLFGENVKELLGDYLSIPASTIVMTNDAICNLAGERLSGAGIGSSHVAAITLGTGLGSAVYDNGEYEMGDLYSMPFRGSRAEEFLSSRWFISEYKNRTNREVSGAKELAAIVNADEVAKQLFIEFGQSLAAVIQLKFGTQIPDQIIIGGNISKAWDLFYPATKATLDDGRWFIVPAELGENAPVIGAAGLWKYK